METTPPYTPRFSRAVKDAKIFAQNENCPYIGTQHLLVVLLTTDQPFVAKVFDLMGVDRHKMSELAKELLGQEALTVSKEESNQARIAALFRKLADDLDALEKE